MPPADGPPPEGRKVKQAPVRVLERTDAIAREILAQQAEKRADLTLRLRTARLAREAQAAKPAKTPPR